MGASTGQLDAAALEALVDADAHLVLCDQRKAPTAASWQLEENRPDAAQAAAHAAAGGLVGVIPASVGIVAVDVDTDGAGSDLHATMLHRRGVVERAIGEPLATVPTRSGGGHMLFRAPDGHVGNARWVYGDIRGSAGYCVVWNADRWLVAISARPAAEPVDIALLPVHDAATASNGNGAADPPAGRNDALSRAAFKRAADAVRTGRPAEFGDLRESALAARLPENEVDYTIRKAVEAAERKVDPAGAPPQRSIAEVDPQTTALVDVILEKHPRIAERGRAFKELVSRGVDRREARELAAGAIPDDDDRPPTEMPLLMASGDDGLIPPAILPGLLWAGYVSLIDAAAKTGKTTLIADALGAVLTGRPWLGEKTDPPAGPVLYFSEMPLDLLRAWLRRHGVPVDAPIRGDKMQSVDVIRQRIEQYRPAAVIVDSLLELNASNGAGNMWHPGDVRKLIKGVRDAGAAALIVHHVRKSDGEMADSRDIAAAVDMIVHFDIGKKYGSEPPIGHTVRRLSYFGRWNEVIRHLEYDTATGRYRMRDAPVPATGDTSTGGGMVPGDGLEPLREYAREWLSRSPIGSFNQFYQDARTSGYGQRRAIMGPVFKAVKAEVTAGVVPEPENPMFKMAGTAETGAGGSANGNRGGTDPEPPREPVPGTSSQHIREPPREPVPGTSSGAVPERVPGTGDRPVCKTCRVRPAAREMDTCLPCVRMLRVWPELRGKGHINADLLRTIMGPEWTVKTAG